MSRHHSHITSAVKIIESATAGEPLSQHLKKFFAADKKYGSKDRKSISSLCYFYYRTGCALKNKTTEEKIIAGFFLCNTEKSELLEKRAPELNEKMRLPVAKKLAYLKIGSADIFPFVNELSEAIDEEQFSSSFLIQPGVFLRLRPGKAVKILERLAETKTDFEEISTSCIAMPPASKAQDLIKLNKEAVVQDLNSQQVFNYLNEDGVFLPKEVAVWDCCAASGGKSILLYDLLHRNIQLHVSDIRENILHNLRNRFKDAGINKYHAFIADLTDEELKLPQKKYEIIICDAPCTGSGTWSRTPEQLYFFDKKNIEDYAVRQKKIALTAMAYLAPGGLFFYITCSVFKKENEQVAQWLKENSGLNLLQMKYLKGDTHRADTLFTAVFSS